MACATDSSIKCMAICVSIIIFYDLLWEMKVAMRITKLPLRNFVKFEDSLLAELNLLLI